jgi:hypothetical protein
LVEIDFLIVNGHDKQNCLIALTNLSLDRNRVNQSTNQLLFSVTNWSRISFISRNTKWSKCCISFFKIKIYADT